MTTDDRVVDGAISTLLHVLRLGGAILVDAATVHDCFGTDQRGTAIDADTRPLRNQDGRFVNAFHVQAGFNAGVMQSNRDFVEVRVTATFAQTVQSNFQLGCTHKETFDGCSRCHAQVIVAVHRDRDILRQGFVHLLDLVHVQQGTIAFHRIRQVDGGRAGFHHGLQHVNYKIHVFEAVTEMFGTEFHRTLVTHQGLCELHAMHGLFLDLFGGQVQHMFHGEGACGEEGMNTRVRSILNRFPATLDIAFHAAGQTGHHDALCNFVAFFGHLGGELSKFLTRFEIHFRRGGETDFGTLHTQLQQLQINIFFLRIIPGFRKGLVTVAQCDVIEERFSFVAHLILFHFVILATPIRRQAHFSSKK